MNIKSIKDIIDIDFVKVCSCELSYEYFYDEMGAFLLCDEIDCDTYLFLVRSVPVELYIS